MEQFKKLSLDSYQKAKNYFGNENFGRAFAHYLVALKLNPSLKKEVQIQFTQALERWGADLEEKERFDDLFNCYEQAIIIFPENTTIYSQLGFVLLRNNAVAPMNKMLAALRFYATGAYMSVIADLGGISESSARFFVNEVTLAIAARRGKFITFPENFEETKIKFFKIARFPGVLMAIDCTHVKILNPGGDDSEVFRNRKGYFSINVQTVCDADLRVLDCVARWPGSTHDQRIFNNSRLMSKLERGDFGQGIVVGDSGYENRPYLVTPLQVVTNREENLFNESIIRTRNPVERSYGVIKRRFPVLSTGLRTDLELTMAVIQAVMVMHNIALQDPLPAPEVNIEKYEEAKIIVEPLSTGQDEAQRKIIVNYFRNLN